VTPYPGNAMQSCAGDAWTPVPGRQHLVQDGDADGRLSPLGGKAAGSQPRSDECLVSAHGRFD
jgi:hypothetical protein